MADSNTRRRVKLYMLNESRVWDDQGTGHVTSAYLDKWKGTALVVRSEVDGKVLLESKVQLNTAYQKQQETLIVWSEADNYDYALSFQDKAGCDEIWEKICQVQGKDPSVEITQDVTEVDAEDMDDDRFDDVHDSSVTSTTTTASFDLPACEIGRLEEIAELFTGTLPTTPIRRERLALAVENESYIRKLIDVYHRCEDLEDLEGLHRLYAIFKALFLLNKTALLETMFADEVIMDVIGVLENDPSSTQPTLHREYLSSQSRLREVIPLTNSELVQKIHQTYRVQYIQDVILPTPSVFDENLLSTLSSFIYFNKMEIVTLVQEDEKFLQSLFSQLKDESIDDAKRRDLVLFLKEFCAFSQTLAQQNREGFFKTLSNFGILTTIKVILGFNDPVMRAAAVDIFSFVVEFSPSMVREFIIHEAQKLNYDNLLINNIIDLMTTDTDPELSGAMQAMGIVRLLIDPENMITTAVKKVISEKTEKSEFLSFFYTHCMHVLMGPLYSNTIGDSPKKDDYHTAQLLSLILELLTFCVEHHTYHSKNYIINKNALRRVLVLLKSRHAFLCLASLRLLRRMIGLKDEFYNRYIVKNDLLKPVGDAFAANGKRYNLFNSAVIELFEFIRTEDLKTLIVYFIERHYKSFESVSYVQTFRTLKQRYEQYVDRLTDKSSSLDSVDSLTSISRSAATRFKRDSRALDVDEEMWFDQDDEDDADLGLVKAKLDMDYEPLDKLLIGNSKLSGVVSSHKTTSRIVNKPSISINIQRLSTVSSAAVTTTSTVSSSLAESTEKTTAKASSVGLVDYPDEDSEEDDGSGDSSLPSPKRTKLDTL